MIRGAFHTVDPEKGRFRALSHGWVRSNDWWSEACSMYGSMLTRKLKPL